MYILNLFSEFLMFIFSLGKNKKNKTRVFEVEKFKDKKVVDVTIILNIWKRKHLEEQLVSIINSSVLPKEVWVIHYENHVNTKETIDKLRTFLPYINLISSNKNLKYFGRFSIAINSTTKFTWLIDDDVIPGSKWLENCVKKSTDLNAIITCTGRIIPKDNYRPEKIKIGLSYKHYIGDAKNGKLMNHCEEDTVVDYGCNSYFFQTEWLSAYWSLWPITFLSGEDIHLCATCKIKLNVSTVVLEQTNESNSGNINRPYGWDENASWKQNNFLDEREKVFRYHIQKNAWTPLEWRTDGDNAK